MIFYILIGLCVGFFVSTTIVLDIVHEAIADNVENVYTQSTARTLLINMVFISLVWFLFIPCVFSESFRLNIAKGFRKAIYAED